MEMKQGAFTTEEPFDLIWKNRNHYEIIYRGERVMWGRSGDPEFVCGIASYLNEAYRAGFC